MTDHHHDHDATHGAHGVQAPPPDDVLAEYEAQEVRGAEPVPLHFFKAGPLDVTPVRPRYIRLRNGQRRRCTWEFRWYLDRVDGVTRSKAITRIYDVLLAPNGWTRAGVHWKRVLRPQDAHILMRVIPKDETVCGPGSAGCYSWGGGKPPVAEVGVEYIDRPGPFAALVGMELQGHGTFRADDQYFDVHQPYPYGIMGDWEAMARAGYMPTESEIEDTRSWLQAKTPSERVHRH